MELYRQRYRSSLCEQKKKTSQVKHFHWEMMQDDTKSVGNYRWQFGSFLPPIVPNTHLLNSHCGP